MSQVPLSPELLLGLVRRVRRKGGPWRPIGIHTRTAYTGPTKLAFAEGGPRVELDVVNCPSLLAVRSALAEERVHPLVFVTQQDEDDLGADVRARIAKGRLQHPGSWEVALDLFEAQTLDPALGKQTWLADELIRARPPSGYAPVPTGVLDAEVAWGAFLREVVGLGDARPDLRSLLRWSSKAGAASRLAAQTSAVRRAVADRLVDSAGSVARAVLHVACSDRSADVVPVGIVAELLFASSFEEDASIQTGVVRLEPLLGGHALSRREGRAWAEAARAVAAGAEESDDVALAGAWYRRAEALLDELRVRAYAHRSDVLPLGFEQRVERLAHALQDWLEAGTKAVPDEAEQAYKMLSQHRVARRERARLQRAEMALRLARWLRRDDVDEAASLAERARSYERDGAFVDRARTQLGAGDAHPALAAVYGRLVDTATKRRERENQDFGTALSGWLASGGSANGILPIEDVLERVLAPVAKSAPALLLVMDGMSHAVYRELLESLGELAWGPQVPAEGNGFDPVVAVLPSVTNVSRTSLLCGRLASGAQSIEKDGFASHPALLAVSRTAKPPVLFHKAEVRESGSAAVPTDLLRELQDPARRVVGLVVNAVDDYLSKGEQVAPRWDVDTIAPLRVILERARYAGRVVVLTSDHGHVLERGSRFVRQGTEASRARPADGSPGEGEVLVEGRRVIGPLGGRLIVPWSEQLRYGTKQTGYHGGASPQEVLVPLAVLAPPEQELAGWRAAAMPAPAWWDGGVDLPVEIHEPAPERAPAPAQVTGLLFDTGEGEPQSAVEPEAPPAPAGTDWVGRLLASPIYADQRRLGGRKPPADEEVREFLMTLAVRGGSLTRAAMVRLLDLPELRLPGLLRAIQRLLNVDGYPVLELDDASDSIQVNVALLEAQFGI